MYNELNTISNIELLFSRKKFIKYQMNTFNFLFTRAQQLQSIEFYRHEFVLHVCVGNYPLSLSFSKMIKADNVDIDELLTKMFKMSPPPLEQILLPANTGNSIQNFFRNPIQKKNPGNKLNKEILIYYYLLHKIQLYYNPNITKIDYTQFYLNSFLIEFSDPKKSIKINGNNITGWAEQLFQYMTSSLDIPKIQNQIILKGLLTFAIQDKALYFSLRPQTLSILARIGAQNYIPILEFNIFDVLSKIDPSILILIPPNLINSSNINKFFQYPAVLFNPQFINLAQNLIGSTEPFPLESSLFNESNLLTLVNHTIMKRKHFVDIIFSLAHNTLMSRDFNNVEVILDVLSSSPQSELKPWLMLLDFNDLYPDQVFLMTVIPLYTDLANRKTNSNQNLNSIQNDGKENLNISDHKNMNMLDRLKNDHILLTYINHAIGIAIGTDEISKESLPKYISGIMKSINLNDFERFSKLEYYVISDNDRDMDFNFIFLYLIYSFVLSSFNDSFKARKKQELNCDDEVLNNNYNSKLNTDQLENYLRNIKIKQDILIDIFSLLFVQDRVSGEYIASIKDAEVLLSVLVQYAHDLIQCDNKSSLSDSKANSILSTIMIGFAKVQQFYVLNDKSSISDCFISSLDTIISALEKHDYEIAERFATQANSEKLLILIKFSKTIYAYTKSNYNEEIITTFLNSLAKTKEDKVVHRFLVELSMSTQQKINEVSNVLLNSENEDESSFRFCLSSLLNERKRNKKEKNIILSSIGLSGNLRDIIEEARLRMFFGGNEVYVDWSDNEDENNRLITPDSFPVLSNFIEHYELFLKLSDNKSSTSTNSEQSLDMILNSIIQSNKIDSWETFTQLVGSNALEMIILHCDLTKASEQIISLITEQMPILSELIKIQKKYHSNSLKKEDKLGHQTIDKILYLVGDKNKKLTDFLTNNKTDEKNETENSSLSLFMKLLNNYSNTDKSTFIIVLFKLISESFSNNDFSFFFTSDNLLSFLDIIDDILEFEDNYNQVMKKVTSLLIDEIINFFDNNQSVTKFLPIPTDFIYELRLRNEIITTSNGEEFELFAKSNEEESPFNIFLPNFVPERKKNLNLSLIDIVNIFPDKASKAIYYLIDHGITSTDPKEIIRQLIERHRIFYAEKFSENDSFLTSIFNNELINYATMKITHIINESDSIQKELTDFVCSLFAEKPKLANMIYLRLPNNLVQSNYQITKAFQSFSVKKVDDDDFSNADSNVYDDFDSQINDLLYENTTLEWVRISVDYVLNIYLNPDVINELDDEYSAFMKKQKIDWNEKRKKLFIQNIQSALSSIIKKKYSHINSVEDEQISFRALKMSIQTIEKIVSTFKLEDNIYIYAESLKFLLDFVCEEYNLRFNERYSLNDINELVEICLKYDNFELIKEKFLITFISQSLPSLFVSSIRNCFVHVAKNLLLLNQTEEYVKVLDFLSNLRTMFAFDSNVDLSELLRILSHPNFFEVNFNKDIVHVEVSPLYYRVKMIIDGNLALVNKEFFKLTDRTIVCFNGEKDLIRFHNKYGRFETNIETKYSPERQGKIDSSSSSFAAIEELIENKNFMKIFLTSISSNSMFFDAFESLESAIEFVIFPALSYDHWNGLWRFLIRNLSSNNNDSRSLRIKALIDKFLEFLRAKNMIFSMFDIENRLQMREDAILAASEIFNSLFTWSDRANYSRILKELCENEIKSRKNEGKKPEKVSDGVLNAFYEKSSIYSEFCQFCHDTNTNFDKNLNIFSKGIVINSNNSNSYQPQSRFQKKDERNPNDHIIELMAFLAFVKKNFVLGLKIAKMKPTCVESVIKNSIETIFCAGNNEIKAFMIELKNQLYMSSSNQTSKLSSNSDYETIAMIAVECVEKKLSKKAALSRFIIDYVSGNSLRVSLLVKYGFPHEALKICNHDKQNIKIVQEYALQINDSKLIRECKKFLS